MRILAFEGIGNALINGGGGDVFYRDSWQGRPWRVGLRDPRQPTRGPHGLSLLARGSQALKAVKAVNGGWPG